MIASVGCAGCAGTEASEPGGLASRAAAVALSQPRTICYSADSNDYQDLASVTVRISADHGETLYLFAKTTVLRVPSSDDTPNLLEAMRINCPGRSVQSTRNHRGVGSPDQAGAGMVQHASLLYRPAPGTAEVSCQLQAYVGTSSSRGCLSFQASDDNTWLHPYVQRGGWTWGTYLDTPTPLTTTAIRSR